MKLAQHNGNKLQHNEISTTQQKQAATQQNVSYALCCGEVWQDGKSSDPHSKTLIKDSFIVQYALAEIEHTDSLCWSQGEQHINLTE